MKPWVVRLVKYGCCAVFVVLIACLVFFGSDPPFSQMERQDQFRVLADAFTAPGMLLLLSGGLVAMIRLGAMDGIGYVVSYAIHGLIPGMRMKQESYADYLERKHERPVRGFGFLLISGGVSMGIALVFLIAYSVCTS